MSLLVGNDNGLKIQYQLPLKFDEQMRIISDLRRCVDMQIQDFDYYKVWKYIEKDITIEVDGVEMWIKGEEQTENTKGKMLQYGINSAKLFADKFMLFISEQGVNL